MQYSPKLKKVMQEIKSILKKNDIAGVVILHKVEGFYPAKDGGTMTNGFSEFLLHINTNYSAARIDNDRFIVKGKKMHYPSVKIRNEKVSGAVNMFTHLSEVTSKLSLQVIDMENALRKVAKNDYDDDDEGQYTSHSQQNN